MTGSDFQAPYWPPRSSPYETGVTDSQNTLGCASYSCFNASKNLQYPAYTHNVSYEVFEQMSAPAGHLTSYPQSSGATPPVVSNDFPNDINLPYSQEKLSNPNPPTIASDSFANDVHIPGQKCILPELADRELQPSADCSDIGSHNSVSAPCQPERPENHAVEVPRTECTFSGCPKTFTRDADMQRHAKKHRHGEPQFQCGVRDCGYGGCNRRDKIIQHFRNRHFKGHKDQRIFEIGKFCLPRCSDCLLSQSLLGSEDFAKAIYLGLRGWGHDAIQLLNLLSEDGKGLKKLTPMTEGQIIVHKSLAGEQKKVKLRAIRAKLPPSLQERFKDVQPWW